MASEFRHRRMVEFAETDMAGILHFANYFRFMEEVEHAFFRSLGMTVHGHSESGGVYGWARGHVECSYKRPLRYEDIVELHLLVREKRDKSITYEIIFRKVEPSPQEGEEEIARGFLTAVCTTKDRETGRLFAVSMPPEAKERISVADA